MKRAPYVFVIPLALLAAACGGKTSSPGSTTSGSGTTAAAAAKSEFPIGTLSQCNSLVALDGDMGDSAGDGTVTLAEHDGVITAQFSGGNGLLFTGTVKFEVTTGTTAIALPGQSIDVTDYSDAAPPTEVADGVLALVDGNLVASLVGPAGKNPTWLQCAVPYASCETSPSAPSAPLPSGTYGSCISSSGGGGPTGLGNVVLTRAGGTVTASFSEELVSTVDSQGADGGFRSSVDFKVVGPGTAVSAPAASATTTSVCGDDGYSAVLQVDGDSLFFEGGENWQVNYITCTATNGTAALAVDGGSGATQPDGATLAATDTGRKVASCSACGSTETCVGASFQGDACLRPDGGPASCPSNTSWDTGSSCCVGNPTVSYTCWPLPPTCTEGVTCECASGLVFLACGVPGAGCTPMDGGVTCEELGP